MIVVSVKQFHTGWLFTWQWHKADVPPAELPDDSASLVDRTLDIELNRFDRQIGVG